MVDVQQMAEQLEFGEPLPDFGAIRDQVETLIGEGQPDKARVQLEACLQREDAVRSGDENAWLYARLGDVYQAGDQTDEAIEAYERSFSIEPRSESVSLALSDLLTAQERFEEGLDVARLVLLNHKQEMADEKIATMYRRMGELHEGQHHYEQARVAFEKALVKAPDDKRALTGLLRVVAEVGEPGDVVEARLKLIRSLEDARARSMALLALGNDWITQFNDPGRALDTFEEAVTEWSKNKDAVERIADVAAELGDWRRVCRAYFTLSMLAEKPEQKADYLIKSSDVARRELWEPEKALAGYQKALEWDASRLDAFTSVTSILVDARDWERLEEAYVQVISSNAEAAEPDSQLLGVLWQKLGELYSEHLERYGDAVFAYSQAIEHLPHRHEIRKQIVDLGEEREEYFDEASVQLRKLMELEPNNPDWIDRLGRVCLRKKEVDHAYCMFRALEARGESLDKKAAGFLERFGSKIAPSIQGKINPSMMRRYIFSENLDPDLNECFSILKTGLKKFVGVKRRDYGLRRRDRVKLKESLAFVNFYKKVGAALGYVDLPRLWKKSDQQGLVNGGLVKPGFLVGEQLLRSAREKEIAFVVAKQLCLFLEPFYLATIRPMTDLQAFFLCAVALVRPDTGLADQFEHEKAYKKAYKSMRKKISDAEQTRLRECINKLTGDNDEVVLGPWLEAIEDSANRMGLLFCDDLDVARECLRKESESISQRSTTERMNALIDYSISEKYLSLRPQLGIEVA